MWPKDSPDALERQAGSTKASKSTRDIWSETGTKLGKKALWVYPQNAPMICQPETEKKVTV
jgi:hypothetical protein